MRTGGSKRQFCNKSFSDWRSRKRRAMSSNTRLTGRLPIPRLVCRCEDSKPAERVGHCDPHVMESNTVVFCLASIVIGLSQVGTLLSSHICQAQNQNQTKRAKSLILHHLPSAESGFRSSDNGALLAVRYCEACLRTRGRNSDVRGRF